MNVGDRLTLSITDVAYRGRAVGRHDGQVVFVFGALPGETVDVEVTSLSRNFAEAVLVGVATPSPGRISPACPLAADCPGCRYQHASYEAEMRMKQAQLVNLLGRLGRLDPKVCSEPVASPSQLGYRNKIVLHAWVEDESRILGYFSEDNRTVIDVPCCPLASERINSHLSGLRADAGFMESLETHNKVTIRETEVDGVSHWIGAVHDQGRPWLTETTPVGAVQVPRGSFFQVNPLVGEMLLREVGEHIGALAPEALVDVYGGVGLFGFVAARQGVERVCSLDMDGAAAEAGRENARRLGLCNVEFISGPAQKKLAPILMALRGSRMAAVVDPPRTGLEPGTLRTLLRSNPAGIIYVSCAPDTLARDLRQLGDAGYRVQQTRLFDMFPRTPFFESVTLLVRQG